mmetsp:Transcript_8208/g.19274  ORF Transcript_8208/g.19274 Transcript_8208/m.19274 type:complete len:93 (-) Transcript_8208:97-375(-)
MEATIARRAIGCLNSSGRMKEIVQVVCYTAEYVTPDKFFPSFCDGRGGRRPSCHLKRAFNEACHESWQCEGDECDPFEEARCANGRCSGLFF